MRERLTTGCSGTPASRRPLTRGVGHNKDRKEKHMKIQLCLIAMSVVIMVSAAISYSQQPITRHAELADMITSGNWKALTN